MKISTLYEVLNIVNEYISTTRLITLYNEINQTLASIRSYDYNIFQSEGNNKTSFLNSKKSALNQLEILKTKLFNINITNNIKDLMNIEQYNLFKSMVQYRYIGENGNNNIREIFEKNTFDIDEILESMSHARSVLDFGDELKHHMMRNINPNVTIEEIIPESDKIISTIYFQNNTSIETTDDLKFHVKEWEDIVRNFSRLVKEPNEEIKIHSINNGSVILSLFLGAVPSILIAKTIHEIANLYMAKARVKEDKKLLSFMDLDEYQYSLMSNALQEKEDQIIDKGIDNISNKLITEYGEKIQNDNDKEEVYSSVKFSIKKVFNFIDKGGAFEMDKNNQNENPEVQKVKLELISSYSTIKLIEEKGVPLITDGKSGV